jgi:Protein of unknown function (DUF4235)
MTKLLFIPFGVIGGIIAGFLSKKTFEALWSVIDDRKAPEPQHREVPLIRLVLALVLQGAIFRAVRGLFDHGARRAFQRLTGSWPGEEQPEQA